MTKLTALVLGFWLVASGCGRDDGIGSTPPVEDSRSATERISEVLADRNPYSRVARLATLLETLGPEDAPEVSRIVRIESQELAGVETILLLRFWAEHLPRQAVAFTYLDLSIAYRPFALAPLIETWARQAPLDAMQNVRYVMGTSPHSSIAEIALVRGWYESGEPGLEQYIQDLGASFERQRALGALAGIRIAHEGIPAAMAWVEGLPDDDEPFKLTASRRLASELAKVDSAAAVEWCQRHCAGPYGSNLPTRIVTAWGTRDGRAAMDFLEGLPANQDRANAVKDAYRAWARTDREGLYAWIEGIGMSGIEPWLHPAVESFAIEISGARPLESLEWAAIIDDDDMRERLYISIARRWRDNDQVAADAWVEQSQLSEEARELARQDTPMRARQKREAQRQR